MDFDLTDEQRLLKDGVERLLLERYGFQQRKQYMAEPTGWSREQWARYAELGLLALPFAERDGGLDGGPVEMLLVMEAFGRALVLEPYLATVVIGGAFLRLAANSQQRARLIPRIADGSLLLAFAQAEEQSRYDLADVATSARREGQHWVLDGTKRFVLHGDCADKLIVTARISGQQRDSAGLGLFLVDTDATGVRRRSYVTQDRLRAADIAFDGVRTESDAVIGEPGAAHPMIERVVSLATAALCAEAVGVMANALEVTTDYLKIRKQFGVPIGSFQALQHRAADMLMMVELARGMAMHATMTGDDPDPSERSRAIAAAKVQVGRAGKFVCGQAIQLHGGIGMTDACQIGHYYRRLMMIDLMFGDSSYHLSALARAGGLIPVET